MTLLIVLMVVGVGLGIAVAASELKRTGVLAWLPGYLRQRAMNREATRKAGRAETVHVLFAMVDHFEPISKGSTQEEERARMRMWLEGYPTLAARHRDSSGRPPQHSWFYPIENYRSEYLEGLTELCRKGLGEIEVHLHHGHDTSESLEQKFCKGLEDFSKHGAQRTQGIPSKTAYAFIHGNMALDNSRFDPTYCGVNDELRILRRTGCYADFSFPTAPCVSQPQKVNAIYYATDDPAQPKSFDTGVDVQVGGRAVGDLMLIQGPIALNWSSRKWGLFPRIENSEIQGSNPPTTARVRLWIDQHIHVKGRPEWIVVKVSCHGAEERSWDALFGKPAEEMYAYLESHYRDRKGYRLHYVTARELYNIVKAAEAGETGDPGQYKDFLLPPYQTHKAA